MILLVGLIIAIAFFADAVSAFVCPTFDTLGGSRIGNQCRQLLNAIAVR